MVPIRVTGRIHRDAKLLEAPLSRRPCVGYELLIDEISIAVPSLWPRVLELRQACPFLLRDDSGTARIDHGGPSLRGPDSRPRRRDQRRYPGNHRELSMVLESCGLLPMTWLGRWRPPRYAEGVLEPGELVTVGGDARANRSGWRGPSPRRPPRRLVIRGSEAEPLLITCVRTEPWIEAAHLRGGDCLRSGISFGRRHFVRGTSAMTEMGV